MDQIAWRNVGPSTTPQEIMRMRRQMMEACRKLGQPVIFRHLWNRDDVNNNLAKQCPACYLPGYDQVMPDCPVCFGMGFVSVENEKTGLIFIDTSGQLTTIGTSGVRAPRYGGFGAPFLTWIIEPDVAVDVIRITEQGQLIRTYDATGVAPWYPTVADNDLCINVSLDKTSQHVETTEDRFQLKMVQQATVRGFGRRSRPHAGSQNYLCQQTFQQNKLPLESNLYNVPFDPDVPDLP